MPSLINWPIFGFKVGIAVALAVFLDSVFNFHDPISAGFVALVCVSPTVLTGMKRASEQLAGSVLGGLIGWIVLLMGGHGPVGIAISVGLSCALSGILKMEVAHVVASFAALWMIVLGDATPTASFWAHLGAVTMGCVTSSLLNLLVSGLLYRMLFVRRMRILRGMLSDCFAAASQGEDHFGPAFGMISSVSAELSDASKEVLAKWLRVDKLLLEFLQEITLLEEVAHFGRDALLRNEGSPELFMETREALRGANPPSGSHPLVDAAQRWSLVPKTL